MSLFALCAALCAAAAFGHGFLLDPPSRTYLSWSPFKWTSCPHCVDADPVYSPDGVEADPPRIFPGEQPFAEPGSAKTLGGTSTYDIDVGPAGASTKFGVCGAIVGNNDVLLDYNYPSVPLLVVSARRRLRRRFENLRRGRRLRL
ncbi:hypothetical protein M885DRAFT_496972 [Pelagophyceae sp. CCMP2097]|nr:hypothetical protein M885DRAFT_496972 [Pelagophyceae sp. CCMP2097]